MIGLSSARFRNGRPPDVSGKRLDGEAAVRTRKN